MALVWRVIHQVQMSNITWDSVQNERIPKLGDVFGQFCYTSTTLVFLQFWVHAAGLNTHCQDREEIVCGGVFHWTIFSWTYRWKSPLRLIQCNTACEGDVQSQSAGWGGNTEIRIDVTSVGQHSSSWLRKSVMVELNFLRVQAPFSCCDKCI